MSEHSPDEIFRMAQARIAARKEAERLAICWADLSRQLRRAVAGAAL